MSYVHFTAKLPNEVIKALKSSAGCVVTKGGGGDHQILDLTASPTGAATYMEYLHDGRDFVDPWISPGFGNPMAPFVPPVIQAEVFDLLASYEPYTAANFAPAAVPLPFIQAVFPLPMLGIKYHHAKIAIAAVFAEIQNPTRYATNVPFLLALPGLVYFT